MSPAIKYSEIRNGIKFAIDSRVGGFCTLKHLEIPLNQPCLNGNNDLNLIIFRNRKKYFDMEEKIQSEPWSEGIEDIQFFRQQR
jgi:hypothetical protein